MEAASSTGAVTGVAWASSVCAWSKASSARLRSRISFLSSSLTAVSWLVRSTTRCSSSSFMRVISALACLSPGVSIISQLSCRFAMTNWCVRATSRIFRGSACGERVRAQDGQALIGDRPVERLFVFAEVLPVLLFEPGRISGHSHTGVPSGQCESESLMPTAHHSLEIKRATLEIPVAGRDDVYAVVRPVSIKIGNDLFQRMPHLFLPHGPGNHPQAELLAFQSSLAIGDQRIEEVLFRLVEETHVRAPGHVADDVDSGLPQLGGHHRIPGSAK